MAGGGWKEVGEGGRRRQRGAVPGAEKIMRCSRASGGVLQTEDPTR